MLMLGCFQRVLSIRSVETSNLRAPEQPAVAEGASSEKRYTLLDLRVTRRAWASECTLGFVEHTSGPRCAHLPRARIAYGEAVKGTEVRTQAQELGARSYAASAIVQEDVSAE